jgi:hypothetical protein
LHSFTYSYPYSDQGYTLLAVRMMRFSQHAGFSFVLLVEMGIFILAFMLGGSSVHLLNIMPMFNDHRLIDALSIDRMFTRLPTDMQRHREGYPRAVHLLLPYYVYKVLQAMPHHAQYLNA